MKTKSSFLLAISLFIAVVLACNATTANISSLKLSTDEEGKNESKSFKPGDKVYAIAQISNNPSKVKVKFRVLYDNVDGEKSGELVKGAENMLDINSDRAATFWITLPESGFKNGRYKVEISMLTESGEQKDQETATFEVSGY